jgi:D-alanyl-D-alanine dipeptidase
MALEVIGRFNPFEIPPARSMKGWKEVPIVESDQPLVCLNDLNDNSILVQPQYYLNGTKSASERMYVRQGVAERLIHASKLLPKDLRLIVFDAYRPYEVQQELFNQFKETIRSKYPDKSEEEITLMTETYVSIPSVDSSKPSPHSTGGAVDLSVVDRNDKVLDMGTPFDSFDISSRTDFFKDTSSLYHTNRSILYEAMVQAGFTNYPEEWWHYDFGNQFWALINKNSALYGLRKGGDDFMQERKEAFSPITEGPFFVNLKAGGESGGPITEGRLIVGGPAGVSDFVDKARAEINELPDGLGYRELNERATEILGTYNLYRIDF